MSRNNQEQAPFPNHGGWKFADPARQAVVEPQAGEVELARHSSNPGGLVFADPERQLQVFRTARSFLCGDAVKRGDNAFGISTPVTVDSAIRRVHRRRATASTIRQSATSAKPVGT